MTNRSDFMTDVRVESGSDHTVSNYKTAFNHFDRFLDEYSLEESEIDAKNIRKLLLYFQDLDLAGSTTEQYLGCIEKYVREMISEEVADKINGFTFDTRSLTEAKTKTKTPILEKKQYAMLRHFVDDTRSELIIQLLWETGIRPSELVKIEIDDIDRDEQMIEIETSKIPIDSNRKRTRKVPYSIEMLSTLQDWLDYGDRARYKTASRSDYLIVTENATQMTSNYVNTLVLEASNKAGIKHAYKEVKEDDEEVPEKTKKNQYFPNARHFRNSFATYRIQNGMDLETLRAMMGHHDVSVTAKYVKEQSEVIKEKNEHYRPKTSGMNTEFVREL